MYNNQYDSHYLIIGKLQKWWKKFSSHVFHNKVILRPETKKHIKDVSMKESNLNWLPTNYEPEQRQCIVRSSSAMEHINERKGDHHISLNRSSSLRYLLCICNLGLEH